VGSGYSTTKLTDIDLVLGKCNEVLQILLEDNEKYTLLGECQNVHFPLCWPWTPKEGMQWNAGRPCSVLKVWTEGQILEVADRGPTIST
jgi:hypothetical protein